MDFDTMVITDEAANTSETFTITPTQDRYYSDIEEVFNLIEGRFYTIELSNSSNNHVVFKGKIFCTNQDTDSYSINSGEYIQHESDNEFVIINE